MGSLKDRLRRLEGPRKPKPCPECSGRIIFAEHRPDGTVDYPMGGPCSTCENRPADGSVGVIRVMLSTDGTAEKTRRGANHVWP